MCCVDPDFGPLPKKQIRHGTNVGNGGKSGTEIRVRQQAATRAKTGRQWAKIPAASRRNRRPIFRFLPYDDIAFGKKTGFWKMFFIFLTGMTRRKSCDCTDLKIPSIGFEPTTYGLGSKKGIIIAFQCNVRRIKSLRCNRRNFRSLRPRPIVSLSYSMAPFCSALFSALVVRRLRFRLLKNRGIASNISIQLIRQLPDMLDRHPDVVPDYSILHGNFALDSVSKIYSIIENSLEMLHQCPHDGC